MIVSARVATWLLKTEPKTYSFADLVRDETTRWDGIANPTALRHLRAAKKGDRAVVYHTGDERAAVGVAEIARAAYPDPNDASAVVVDLAAKTALKRPVTLATLKSDPAFAESPLVRQGRLSFLPLTEAQWKRLLELSK